MGKRMNKNGDQKTSMYEREQVHKKHRGKSDKMAKRIKFKREKKKLKTHHFEQRTFTKSIMKAFKDHKKKVELSKLPFDFDELAKAVRMILSHEDNDSVERIVDAFKKMERSPKEISLGKFENKAIIKDVVKLMKVLKVHQNLNCPLKFSLYFMFGQRNVKARFTTSVEEIIRECLESYSLFVKAAFDYYKQEKKEETNEEVAEEDKGQEEVMNAEEGGLDKDKDMLEAEYEVIGNEMGQNCDLINRAFHKILRDDSKLSHKHQLPNPSIEEQEEEAVKSRLPPLEFLKMTMKLLNQS